MAGRPPRSPSACTFSSSRAAVKRAGKRGSGRPHSFEAGFVVVRGVGSDMGAHGRPDGPLVEGFGGRRAADPTAVLLAGRSGDGRGLNLRVPRVPRDATSVGG